jgi:hypothetical protein
MSGRLPLLLLLCAGCVARTATPPDKAIPSASRAPYESAPTATHTVEVEVDGRAAREILATLARPHYEPADAKRLEDLPAVRLTIRDSGRTAESFERDLAAAFVEESRPAVFDFGPIRKGRERWGVLLEAIAARERELVRMASDRARALLPADRALSLRMKVFLSFGLAGLADHLLVTTPEGQEVMIVDLARALGEAEEEPVPAQLERVARLIAGEAFRRAWSDYRRGHPSWSRSPAALGPVAPLIRIVAEAGPVAIFFVDENFFPLSVWLKEPMKRNLDELNRTAERLITAEGDLDQRVTLAAEIQRPEFSRRLAGPAGAFLADGIFQVSGIDALRAALAGGPRAFFEAYDRAAQQDRNLLPLSREIRDRLTSPPSPGS